VGWGVVIVGEVSLHYRIGRVDLVSVFFLLLDLDRGARVHRSHLRLMSLRGVGVEAVAVVEGRESVLVVLVQESRHQVGLPTVELL
jgi:hypothetical protein